MMGSSRAKEKGKAPAYANSISPNMHPATGVTFLEGNVDEDRFGSTLDMPLSIASWEDIHQSVAHGVPEPIRNPRVYSVDHNSLQNPQINQRSNTDNTNLQEIPLLADCNMGWGQEYVNQGHNAIPLGKESSFGSFNRSQVNRDVTGSSFLCCPRDNINQSGVKGKFEGSFLSLGLGSTSEAVSSSKLDNREISDKLKEAPSNELKMTCDWGDTGQAFNDGFVGSQSNNCGFSSQFSHVSQMTSTNNDDGFMGSRPYHILQMQQNDRQPCRTGKLTESASSELKMVHAQKATGRTLDADFMGFQRNKSGFSNQFSSVDRMTSTNHEVGVHSTLNSGQGSSRHHVSQMRQHDSRNIRSGDLDHYKSTQSVPSGTLGRNSAHFFNSQQHKLKSPEFVKPSWMASYHTPSEQLQHFHSTTANSPNYAGQVISHNASPSQVLEGSLFSQRTATPQVSWVGRGLAGIDAPFPKRLGVESSVRNIPHSSQGHLAPLGPHLQKTNTGQTGQYLDKGSTRIPIRPIGHSDGAPVSHLVNYQDPFFAYGQSQNELIQLPRGPPGAPSTNASSVGRQSQKLDFHVRRHHKRTAVAPQSSSHWVQRQKIIHPTIHHSMSKSPIPVTTALVHPSIPVRSRTRLTGPGAAHIPPVIPRVSNVKPRVPVASAPAVSHITWKDPEATSRLSGYKCFLCKRDLALTSEGPVFQPVVAPSVAILPCGHTFHDQCLQNITPGDQAKDPPCIPCAIRED